MLEPSSRIKNGYRPLVIALSDGTVATGVLRSESEDHLELIDSGLRPLRFAKADVVECRLGDTSPMPAGLVDGLTPGEFADLIAFLESLRRRDSPLQQSGRSRVAWPAAIMHERGGNVRQENRDPG